MVVLHVGWWHGDGVNGDGCGGCGYCRGWIGSGEVSAVENGAAVVAVVDMVAAAVGVSGVGGGVVMKMWRLGCMATVGGESDRSGDGKCFLGSLKNFSGGGSRPEMVAGGGGGRPAAGEEGGRE
nr:hypothetical protein [Tanacetum cinerariifolium]